MHFYVSLFFFLFICILVFQIVYYFMFAMNINMATMLLAASTLWIPQAFY